METKCKLEYFVYQLVSNFPFTAFSECQVVQYDKKIQSHKLKSGRLVDTIIIITTVQETNCDTSES